MELSSTSFVDPSGFCYGNGCVTEFRSFVDTKGIVGMSSARLAGDPFEAIGDPTRREILRLLSEGDKPVHEIASALPISRPAVSRHLKLLSDAGLVAQKAEGTRRIYHLEEAGLDSVKTFLEGVWGEAAARFRLVAENSERERSK